jgi:hypothetical protein
MNDLQLLTKDLQAQSLSKREIVLPYREALQALDVLADANWAVLGWEGWVRYPDGRYGHAPNGMGTVMLDQADGEGWDAYVRRSARFCRDTIEVEQQLWNADPGHASLTLYFCLTPTEEVYAGSSHAMLDTKDGSLQSPQKAFMPIFSRL